MLQGAIIDLINPLVSIAHNSECQSVPFPLQIKPVKVSFSQLADMYFFAPSALMGQPIPSCTAIFDTPNYFPN